MSARVALLAATSLPWHRHGGLERHVFQLCRWLRKRDVGVDLFTSTPEHAAEPFAADGGFRLSVVPGRPFLRGRFAVVLSRNTLYPLFSLRMGRQVLAEARSRAYAAVIAQGLAGFGYAHYAARRVGSPSLILNPQGMEESLTPSAVKRFAYLPFRALTRYAARRAAVTIATDTSFAAVVERVLGVSPERVEVIPNAIDVDECLRLADAERARRLCEQFGVAGAHPLIVTVGRLAPNKGFAVGLEALARSGLPASWRWVVIGDGPLARELRSEARRLGLGDCVRFIGGVSDADMHSLLARADLFLNPTLYEGSSLVTLEAMAHGCAVVATRAGGIPDKIEDAKTGWLAEPGDADSLAGVRALVDGRRRGEDAYSRRGGRALPSAIRLAALRGSLPRGDARPRGTIRRIATLPTRILTALARVAPLLLVLYAALLRFDALITKYGLIAGSPRFEAAEHRAQALGDRLRPAGLQWRFVGERHGDPVSYLKIARAKRSFYGASVREPVPLCTIQFFLWLTGGQDIAVSCASAFYSALLVLAAYLVGSFSFSRGVGLAAGCLLAIEAWLIDYGVDGWRDDGFAFFVLMTAYWLLRLRRTPSVANASIAGVFAAAACLTRLTSPSFVAPALAYLVIDGPREARARRTAGAALAFGVTAALIVPFLVNNWIAFGDPFISFDFATELYRGSGSLPVDRPMAWAGWFADRGAAHPLATVDSLVHGFTAYPFVNKWEGLRYLSPLLALVLRTAAIVGLVLLLTSADGRLLLVVLFTAVIPFAVIWQAPAASQWRLTVFTYPFYLIAAVQALRTASSLACRDVRRGLIDSFRSKPRRWALGGIVTIVGVPVALVLMPPCWQYLLVREAAITDGAYSIVAGPADALFFGEGWYPPVRTGNVTGRYSRGAKAVIHFPVFVLTDSLLTLRMQPYSNQAEPIRNVRVSINRAEPSELRLEWNAQRAESYDVAVPKELLHEGWNTIDLEADGSTAVPPDEQRFVGLRAGQDTAFFLWYVRLTAAHR